jgi:hypothetical protein
MGPKGLVLRPRCIGPRRAQTHILFLYFLSTPLRHIGGVKLQLHSLTLAAVDGSQQTSCDHFTPRNKAQ